MTRELSAEHGQMLVILVAIFTVVLLLAAILVDTSFWLLARRSVQNDADLAARAGALALAANSSGAAACGAAADAADTNGHTLTGCFHDAGNCFDTMSGTAVYTQVEQEINAIFSRLVGFGAVTAGADSIACLSPSDVFDASDDDRALPFLLNSAHRGGNSCFDSSGVLRVGRECAVYRSLDFNAAGSTERLIFEPDDDDECWGNRPGNRWVPNNLSFSFTCRAAPPGTNGCPGFLDETYQCVRTRNVESDNWQEDIFQELEDRLPSGGSCTTFTASFSSLDGTNPAPPAIPGGSNAARELIYVHDACFSNDRVAFMAITNGTGSDMGGRPITGFAVIYITGCYDQNSRIDQASSSKQTNDCRGIDDDDVDDFEVRGIPIRVYDPERATGDIGEMHPYNAPLTILTVE